MEISELNSRQFSKYSYFTHIAIICAISVFFLDFPKKRLAQICLFFTRAVLMQLMTSPLEIVNNDDVFIGINLIKVVSVFCVRFDIVTVEAVKHTVFLRYSYNALLTARRSAAFWGSKLHASTRLLPVSGWLLGWLILQPWEWMQYVSLNRRGIYTGLTQHYTREYSGFGVSRHCCLKFIEGLKEAGVRT
jgi:hypothetical protein